MFGANPFGWAYLGEAFPEEGSDTGAPFISSTTQVFTPTLQHGEAEAPFIASTTTVFTPTLTIFTRTRVSQTAIEVLEQPVSRVRLSQLATEVLKQRPVTTTVALSQVAIEVLVPNLPIFIPQIIRFN